jgi:hypothetical protein
MPSVDNGELLVSLNADISGLKSALKDATEMLKNMQSSMDNLESGVKKNASNMGSSFDQIALEVKTMKGTIEESALESMYVMDRLQGSIQKGAKLTTLGDLGKYIRNVNSNITTSTTQLDKSLNAMMSQQERHLKLFAEGMHKLGSNMDESFRRGSTNLRQIPRLLDENRNHTNSWMESFKQFAIHTYIIRSFLEFAAREVAEIFTPGIQFARQMETEMYGIAAVITSTFQKDGQEIPFVNSIKMANQILFDMKQMAITSHSTVQELMLSFQESLAPAAKLGMTIKETEQFTLMAVEAGKTLGMQQAQLAREVRSVLMGGATGTGERSMLAAALNISAKDIQAAKDKVGGVYKYLVDKMKGYQIATQESANSLLGIWSNFLDGLQQTQAAGFAGLYQYIKNEGSELDNLFFKLKRYKEDVKDDKGNVTHKKGEIENYEGLNENIIAVWKQAAEVAVNVWERLKANVIALLPVLKGLWDAFSSGIKLLWDTGATIGKVFSPAIAVSIKGIALTLEGLARVFQLLDNYLAIATGLSILFFSVWAATKITDIVSAFTSFLSNLKAAIVIIRSATAAQAAYLLVQDVVKLSTLETAAAMLVAALPYATIIAAILATIAVISLFIMNSKDCMNIVSSAFDWMKQKVSNAFDELGIAIGRTSQFILGWLVKIAKGINTLFRTNIDTSDWESNVKIWEDSINGAYKRIHNNNVQASKDVDKLKSSFIGLGNSIKDTFSFKALGLGSGDITNPKVDLSGMTPISGNTSGEEGKGAHSAENTAYKEALEEEEDTVRAKIAVIKAENDDLERLHNKHLIDDAEYYFKLAENQRKINAMEMGMLEKQKLLALEKYNSTTGNDHLNAKKEINRIDSELIQKNIEGTQALKKITDDYTDALKNLKDATDQLQVELLQEQGKTGESEALANRLKYEDKILETTTAIGSATEHYHNAEKTMTDEQKKDAQDNIAELQRTLSIYEQLNNLGKTKANYDGLMAQYQHLETQRAIQTQHIKNDTNLSDRQQKDQIVLLDKNIAQQERSILDMISKLPGLTEEWKEKLAECYNNVGQLNVEISQTQQDMKDALTSGFDAFFQDLQGGKKKMKDAFKDFFKAILQSIVKKLIDNFLDQLFKGLGLNGKNDIASKLSGNQKSMPEPSKFSGGMGGQGAMITQKVPTAQMNQLASATTKVTAGINKMNSAMQPATKNVKTLGADANKSGNELAHKLAPNVKSASDSLKQNLDGATKEVANIQQTTVTTALNQLAMNAMKAAVTLATLAASSGLGGFASGGYIDGPGTETSDSIPSMLSKGEYVLRASAVKKIGVNNLHAMNEGKIPVAKFARGGSVGGPSTTSGGMYSNSYNISMNPTFHSVDPAQNQKIFMEQWPKFKRMMLESMQTEPSTRTIMRRAVM